MDLTSPWKYTMIHATTQTLRMDRFGVKPLTLCPIKGHDVLLDTLMICSKSNIDSSGQHSRESNGSHI